MKKRRKALPSPAEWSFELIDEYHREIARVAQEFELDTFPNQIELITSEQMMDAYASVGMPVNWPAWARSAWRCGPTCRLTSAWTS